jgi:hypothetical protein
MESFLATFTFKEPDENMAVVLNLSGVNAPRSAPETMNLTEYDT